MNKPTGRVFLIGAGCGRWDLMTLRGLQRLQRCDVVVYDDLIDPALLSAAPAQAEKLYMGKRQGKHSASQEEISQTLIDLARAGKTVARLKGGDPFVFGRGGEEMLALRAAGIPCEEVPGIPSPVAIPAGAGIPVTHRGLSRSFHVVTAHTAAHGLPQDLDKLASLSGTLVFLMGLSRLEALARGLMEAGKGPNTPAAVISGGCAPKPMAVRGTLSDIAQKAAQAGVEPPAVILVGEVAALDLTSPLARPLEGISIGLTGTQAIQDKLRPLLEAEGALVHTVMESRVEPRSPDFDPKGLCDGKKRWLIFTSANGVEEFFGRVCRERLDLRRFSACFFAAIGPATGRALECRGIFPDLCPEEHTSAGLARVLCETLSPGTECVLLRSELGAEILPQMLREHGMKVEEIPLYTVQAVPTQDTLPPLSYLLFGSAQGVEAYFAHFSQLPEGVVPVCIGPVTAQRLKEYSHRPFLTADTPSVQAMAEAICRHVTSKKA